MEVTALAVEDKGARLEGLDADGAIRETAEETSAALAADGDTRLDFFKKAGIAGGTVMGGGALLGALVPGAALAAGGGRPPKSFGKGDIGILNYALTLEYLEAAFYNETAANNSGAMTPFVTGQTKVFLDTVVRDENAHVKYLEKALGNKAVKKPKFDFGTTTENLADFTATAVALENTGVRAYSGQALNIDDPKVVKAALSIVTIEARHASVIGVIADPSSKGIAPQGPFDKPLSAKKVLKAVTDTGFIQA
jgi:rubrerythrin